MKKLIFLKQEYIDAKGQKLNKEQAEEARVKTYQQSIETFKQQMGDLFTSKSFIILKEVPPETILIEYSEVVDDKMWAAFRISEIVSVVDSIIPKELL